MSNYAQQKTYPVYSVGPILLDGYDLQHLPDDLAAVIYWYEQGDYEGDGILVELHNDYTVSYGYLGHCSCFGPMDQWSENRDRRMPIAEFRELETYDNAFKMRERMPADSDYKMWQAIFAKFKEIVGG